MILPLFAGAAALVFEQGVMYDSSKHDLVDFTAFECIKKCFDRHNITAVLELNRGVVYVWLYEGHSQHAAMDCVKAHTNQSVAIMDHNSYEDIKGSDAGSELETYIGSFPDYEPTWFEPSDEDSIVMPCLIDAWWLSLVQFHFSLS